MCASPVYIRNPFSQLYVALGTAALQRLWAVFATPRLSDIGDAGLVALLASLAPLLATAVQGWSERSWDADPAHYPAQRAVFASLLRAVAEQNKLVNLGVLQFSHLTLPEQTMEAPFTLPDLAFTRLRMTMRLLADARLPAHKGALFRGGFGYAFQRATCPAPAWSDRLNV